MMILSNVLQPAGAAVDEPESAQYTLKVKQKIEETRARALLGGGPKRIVAQHNKARTLAQI